MAKPSGSVCNIDCDYCFYLEKKHLYPENNPNWKMPDPTLELFIEQYINAQSGPDVHFAWQGGEPTLLGVEFFERVVSLCKKYGEQKRISHAFQTNGILLNTKWCEFLKQNEFLVGVSIDGPQDLHDYYRKTRSGKGTHAQVVAGIDLLKAHNIPFNTLTVINAKNSTHPLRVYQYLKSIGVEYMQFIPLVEREAHHVQPNNLKLVSPDEPFADVTKWSVKSVDYGHFMTTIFDYWVENDVGKIFVQMFDNTLAKWIGNNSGSCVTAETCGHAFAMESNGDLYNCDHFVYPEHKLGNIHNQTIETMNNSELAVNFGLAKKDKLNSYCLQCKYLKLCNGGCPKHRFICTPMGQPNHNYFCEGYQLFFTYTEEIFNQMADLLNQQRSPMEVMIHLRNKKIEAKKHALKANLNRNDKCACGSGKKYKKCCM